MQNTITYDENKAKEVEQAVMTVFGCRLAEIVSLPDTMVKKVVVFVLYQYCRFDKRNIGQAYRMTYLFVPTVAERLEWSMVTKGDLRNKVYQVLNTLGYVREKGLQSA